MLLNISNIGLTDWLFAFLAVIFFLTGIFGIPSIITMYKIGLKAYRQQLRILRLMNRKISTGYKIIHNQVYTYSGSGYNGPSTVTREEINHFFPIIVDKNHLLILRKKEGSFNKLYIQYCEHKKDGWSNDFVEIKTSTCLLTQIINDRFQNKVDNLMKNSVHIDGVENLSELLNSQITSIKREEVLNSILK